MRNFPGVEVKQGKPHSTAECPQLAQPFTSGLTQGDRVAQRCKERTHGVENKPSKAYVVVERNTGRRLFGKVDGSGEWNKTHLNQWNPSMTSQPGHPKTCPRFANHRLRTRVVLHSVRRVGHQPLDI